MPSPKKKKKNPTIRCDLCLRELSQFHLARHRGSHDCLTTAFRERETQKFELKPNEGILGGRNERRFWDLRRKAGFDDPFSGPGCMRVVWGGNALAPVFATVVPRWLEWAIDSIGGPKTAQCSDSPREMDVVVIMEALYGKGDPSAQREYELALTAEIHLTAMNTVESSFGPSWLQLDRKRTVRILRRWASHLLGGTFPET